MTRHAHAERVPIPLTVIGGFLGAGKTTLVNALLAQPQQRRLAILVNDFGALSIDAALISARDARTIALANGCVCCTLVNGLAQALLDVLRLDPPPDHIVVEASGVADPRRIANVARTDRAFAQEATLVVVAADHVQALARDRYVGDTVLRQIASADLIVLNKSDLVGDEALAATSAWLAGIAPRAQVIRAVDAQVPIDLALGVSPWHVAHDDPSCFDGVEDHGGAFASRTLRSPHAMPESALRHTLAALPDGVLRAKGFVRFATAPDVVQLVQLVAGRCAIAPAPMGVSPPGCVLVLIGAAEAFDRADLRDIERLFRQGELSP
jgi:G3E family GTPase